MKNQIALTAAFVLATGCASTSPYRTPGPPVSVQGLQIGISDVRCSVNRNENPLVKLLPQNEGVVDLKLQVKNSSGQVARFSERRIRLVDSTVPAVQGLAPDEAQVFSAFPGETKELAVRFTTSDDLDCRHGFQLALADTVQMGTMPVAVGPISISMPH